LAALRHALRLCVLHGEGLFAFGALSLLIQKFLPRQFISLLLVGERRGLRLVVALLQRPVTVGFLLLFLLGGGRLHDEGVVVDIDVGGCLDVEDGAALVVIADHGVIGWSSQEICMGLANHYPALLGVQPVWIGIAPASLLLTLARPRQLRTEVNNVVATDGAGSPMLLLPLLVVGGSVALLLVTHEGSLLAIG